MNQPAITAVANYHCITGENPLWNDREQRIYWEDIENGRLFRADHATLEHECFYQGGKVGGFTFQEDGTLLLFETDRIASLDPGSGRRVVLREGIDPDMERFNDVTADPAGRVFAGTIGRTQDNGGLYRVDLDGSVRLLWKGTGCANGMGFTRDLRTFYWTCSTTRIVYVCDYDPESGELSNRRPFYTAPESEGTPDGLSVDSEGSLWSARWGGSAVLRISPDARVTGKLELPVSRVSSVTFGGPELDTFYFTTAGGNGKDGDTADGTLYRAAAPVRGQPEYRSRIRL